jgi:hypothetical protein
VSLLTLGLEEPACSSSCSSASSAINATSSSGTSCSRRFAFDFFDMGVLAEREPFGYGSRAISPEVITDKEVAMHVTDHTWASRTQPWTNSAHRAQRHFEEIVIVRVSRGATSTTVNLIKACRYRCVGAPCHRKALMVLVLDNTSQVSTVYI